MSEVTVLAMACVGMMIRIREILFSTVLLHGLLGRPVWILLFVVLVVFRCFECLSVLICVRVGAVFSNCDCDCSSC